MNKRSGVTPFQHRYIVKQRRCRAEADRSNLEGWGESHGKSSHLSVGLLDLGLGSIGGRHFECVCIEKSNRQEQEAKVSRL